MNINHQTGLPNCFGLPEEERRFGCLSYGCPWGDLCADAVRTVVVEWETDRNFEGFYRVHVEGAVALVEERPPWEEGHERTFEELADL